MLVLYRSIIHILSSLVIQRLKEKQGLMKEDQVTERDKETYHMRGHPCLLERASLQRPKLF